MTDPRGRLWSDREITVLLTAYKHDGAERLSRRLPGRTPMAIRLKEHRMGLRRAPLTMADIVSRLTVSSQGKLAA